MKSIMNGYWDEVAFGEVVESSLFGPRFSSDNYAEDGRIASLRTTDLSEDGRISYGTMPLARLDEAKFSKHFLKSGDLVISRSGRVGTTAVFDNFPLPVLPAAFLIRCRLIEEVNPLFYRYWFNSYVGQQRVHSIARGVAQQNINKTNLLKLGVPLPPRSVQDRIVEILAAYDDLIETNQRRIARLEEAARLLYREWFVHLRFPGHEHTPVTDGVPEGWKRVQLKEVVSLVNGKSPERKEEGKYPIYGSNGIIGRSGKYLHDNGIVIGRVGACGRVHMSRSRFWPSDNSIVASPRQKEVSNGYLYHLLDTLDLERLAGGSAQPLLTQRVILMRR